MNLTFNGFSSEFKTCVEKEMERLLSNEIKEIRSENERLLHGSRYKTGVIRRLNAKLDSILDD